MNLGVHNGRAQWVRTMAVQNGRAKWACTMGVYNGRVQECILPIHVKPPRNTNDILIYFGRYCRLTVILLMLDNGAVLCVLFNCKVKVTVIMKMPVMCWFVCALVISTQAGTFQGSRPWRERHIDRWSRRGNWPWPPPPSRRTQSVWSAWFSGTRRAAKIPEILESPRQRSRRSGCRPSSKCAG